MGTLGLVLAAGTAPARAELGTCNASKLDSFVLFVDQSGSMYQRHREAGEIKEHLAKQALLAMNSMVPAFEYDASLYMFAPFASVMELSPYKRGAMRTGIGWIPDSQPIAPRLTPMARGFDDLRPVVGGMKGRTAVIVFSDGGANTGGDPVEAARALVQGRPNTCLHVVSFADEESGREVNQQLSRIAPDCRSADGRELLADGAKMQAFVHDVFCSEKIARKLVLRGVNFDFDKSDIRSDGRPVLDEAIRVLQAEPGVTVTVEGHTDSMGTDAYNQALSERRARAVASYLKAGGISGKRLSTVGYGESKPVASNATDDGRAQNRRVEFRIREK
jgi:OOP family OmpA-OmpF porin